MLVSVGFVVEFQLPNLVCCCLLMIKIPKNYTNTKMMLQKTLFTIKQLCCQINLNEIKQRQEIVIKV